jgi:cytochrome c oxidase subunit 2
MGLLLWSIFSQAHAAWTVNMAPGATEVSHAVFDLHMTIFWICVVIGIVVFGAMFWSMIVHRRSTGQVAAKFHESTTVEILWTVVPLLILVAMAIPATRTLINIYDTSEPDIDIQITGYQWKWHYKYLGQDVEFFSNLATPAEQIHNKEAKGEHYLLEVDQPLVLPVGAKVRFLVTAADVIHSWWVPAFAVKRDAIPGFVNEAWTRIEKPGIYRGQCAELCGKDHGFMPIVVEVKSKADYDTWLGERKAEAAKLKELTSKEWTLDELVARRQGLPHHLRGLSPGRRPGPAADVPGAQGLEDRHRAEGRPPEHRLPRQARHRHGGVRQAALGSRYRRGGDLRAQRLGQQQGRHGHAERRAGAQAGGKQMTGRRGQPGLQETGHERSDR